MYTSKDFDTQDFYQWWASYTATDDPNFDYDQQDVSKIVREINP